VNPGNIFTSGPHTLCKYAYQQNKVGVYKYARYHLIIPSDSQRFDFIFKLETGKIGSLNKEFLSRVLYILSLTS